MTGYDKSENRCHLPGTGEEDRRSLRAKGHVKEA